MELRTLASADLEVARALLAANDLPVDDLEDPNITLVGAFDGGVLAGVIGLQVCNEVGLLRSLAVAPTMRSRKLGWQLCDHVLALADARGLDAVFLLTTDAADYFGRLGFVIVDRESAPDAIRATTQFSSLCPSSARLMRRPA
jgi:amino-acid N-acetyltransferase